MLPSSKMKNARYIYSVLLLPVEECVKLLAKQLSQSIVCHGFMQQRLLHICHRRMVGYHDGYLATTLVVEALGTLAPPLQCRGISHHLYVIKV